MPYEQCRALVKATPGVRFFVIVEVSDRLGPRRMSPCPSSVSQICRAAGVILEAEPVTAASSVDMVAA
jgi:hypothetical protein